MRPSVPTSAASPLLWFGVVGAPLSWVAQFGFNYWLTEADCSVAGTRWGIALNAWVIGATLVSAAVALAAGLTSLLLFRATSAADHDTPPPPGRTHFLATVGIAITPLFLAIIVMNGVGATILPDCHQS
jgi:hypothetical protein